MSTPFSHRRRRAIASLAAGLMAAATPYTASRAEGDSGLDNINRLRLAAAVFTPDLKAIRRAWLEFPILLEQGPQTLTSTFRALKAAGRLYTFQTWNYEYVDAQAWLDFAAANYAMYSHYYRMLEDASFAAVQIETARAALGRMAKRLNEQFPPRESDAASNVYRDMLPPAAPSSFSARAGNGEAVSTSVLWGDLHAHSAFSYDAYGSPTHTYKFAADVVGLDFFAVTDHAFRFGSGHHPYFDTDAAQMYQMVLDAVDAFYRQNRFTTFAGIEWGGRFAQGHRQVLFAGDKSPSFPYSALDEKSNSLSRLWRALDRAGERALTIPHHTAFAENSMGAELIHHDARFQRVIEIASDNGVFEYPGEVLSASKTGRTHPGRSVSDALNRGQRLGIVGGTDCHLAIPGLYRPEVTGFGGRPGLTAVYARENSREAIFEALYQRRCYATDGERISLLFRINGEMMGAELVMRPVSDINIEIQVSAAANVVKVVVLRNEATFRVIEPNETTVKLELKVEGEDLEGKRLTQSSRSKRTADQFRVRVELSNGARAWSSPIWIDYAV